YQTLQFFHYALSLCVYLLPLLAATAPLACLHQASLRLLASTSRAIYRAAITRASFISSRCTNPSKSLMGQVSTSNTSGSSPGNEDSYKSSASATVISCSIYPGDSVMRFNQVSFLAP